MPTSLNFPLRVALFTDTYYEANGVATLSRHLVDFAQSRGLPFLLVHGGRQTRISREGSLQTVELKRGAAAFRVDKSLYSDPLLTRHRHLVTEQLLEFKPDLIHITGPGDLGFLGLLLSRRLHVPLVASWHTNLHEYLARRLDRFLNLMPKQLRDRASHAIERHSLRALLRFYRFARFVLAPNDTLVNLLHERNGKPAFLMPHGVDLAEYYPAPEASADLPFCIGYVGRLTTEKNIRLFVELEEKLIAAGERNYKFLIVGEGGQQGWLRKNLKNAELPGVLRGKELAAAYARMDAFIFPSRTDTFGLVILEAMASGVPVILARETGQRIGIEDGVSGFLSDDFAASLRCLMHDHSLRLAMGRSARKFAISNSWSNVFEQLYSAYAEGLSMVNDRAAQSQAAVANG